MERYLEEYIAGHPKSYQMYEEAKKLLPLGVTSNIRAHKPFPFFVERTGGARVWDIDGNEYIDCQLAYGPTMVGHDHPLLSAAVKKQIDKGVTYGIPHAAEAAVARLIRERFPFVDMVRYSCSGTEATMHAIRLARAFTGREKIIKLEGGFHGAQDHALWSIHPELSAAGPSQAPVSVVNSRGVPACLQELTVIVPFNDIPALEKAVHDNRGQIAGFILEPVMANSSVILPRDNYLQQIRDITAREDIVLIFDEVITGCRASWGGASGYYGVAPDLIALAKAIGGGYPLSVIGGREDIMRTIENGAAHWGTYGGNPLSLCAAETVLRDILTPEATEAVCDKTGRAFDEMRGMLKRAGITAFAENIGAMGSICFGVEDVKDYRDMCRFDADMWFKFFITMLNNGVIMIGADPTETIFFSVQHTDDDIDLVLRAFEKTVNTL